MKLWSFEVVKLWPWIGALMLILPGLAGCVKNEAPVDFSLSPDADGTYSMVYYASDKAKGWLVEEMVSLHGGKAQAVIRTVRPALVYISPAAASASLPALFYAERGDKLTVTGSGSDPMAWIVKGNKLSEQIAEWRTATAKSLKTAVNADARTDMVNQAVSSYVTKNPAQSAAALILYCYYDRRRDEAGFYKLVNMLKDDAAKPEWRALVSRADIEPDAEMRNPDKLPAVLVLKTFDNGADTIVPGRVPAIIYFTRNNVKSYADDMALLRELSREYKDSSRRVIADVSFETDSMARRYKLRADSLKGAVRAWMPLGVSDSTARVLGVSRVPYVLVIDGKGKLRYRGADMNRADSVFRAVNS